MTDLFRQSVASLTTAYAVGKTDPIAVLDSVLTRLDAANPILNAVIAQDRPAARKAAEASAARWRAGVSSGPLDGIPFTVKDNIVTAGLPTTWGSPVFQHF